MEEMEAREILETLERVMPRAEAPVLEFRYHALPDGELRHIARVQCRLLLGPVWSEWEVEDERPEGGWWGRWGVAVLDDVLRVDGDGWAVAPVEPGASYVILLHEREWTPKEGYCASGYELRLVRAWRL